MNPAAIKIFLPGIVVDAAITDKDIYEFYLVSVAARQGMTSPTRYTMVYDSMGGSPHLIESLTYKLYFTYYNVSGAIKESSLIRYAHRLAALLKREEVAAMTHHSPIKVLKKRIQVSTSSDYVHVIN